MKLESKKDVIGVASHALFAGRVNVGDTVKYRVIPYRGAEMVEREGLFCMWDYEHTGGLGGSYRTGHYVIDRGNGLADIISYDQISWAERLGPAAPLTSAAQLKGIEDGKYL